MASRRQPRRHHRSGSKAVPVRSYRRKRPRRNAQTGDGIIDDIGDAIKSIGNFSKKHRILGNTNAVLNATPLGGLLEGIPIVGKVLRQGIRAGAKRGYGATRGRGRGAGAKRGRGKRGAGIKL